MLYKSFNIKDLGVADFILGKKNLQNSTRISIITISLHWKDTGQVQASEFQRSENFDRFVPCSCKE